MRYNSESGRSMVEMLGTLAIIGVLSIAGIMGYRHAILRYKANETIQELTLRSVIHSQQIQAKATLNQDEMGSVTKQGFPITVAAFRDKGYQLTIQGIEGTLCQTIIHLDWKLPTQIQVNGAIGDDNASLCSQEKLNALSFIFLGDIQSCETDDDCLCGTCENGECQNTCAVGEQCAKNFDNGQFECCPESQLVNGVCCKNKDSNGNCCNSENQYCCPPDKPMMDWSGNCYSCDKKETIDFGWTSDNRKESCLRCANRVPINAAWATAKCAYPCSSEDLVMDGGGKCHTCDEQAEQIGVHGTINECHKCSGIRFLGGNLDGDYNWANVCWRCDSNRQTIFMGHTGRSEQSKAACRACPNRILINDFYCAKFCPEESPLMDNRGKCHMSSEENDFNVYGVPDDIKCQAKGIRYLDGNICKKCPTDISGLTEAQQAQCQSPQI